MSYIKTILLIAIILFPKIALSGIREYCEDQWPENYEMIEYCEDSQYEALKKFNQYAENLGLVKDNVIHASSDGSDGERIIYKCMEEWESPLFDTYNYEMVVYCIEGQFDAHNRLYLKIDYKTTNKKKIRPASKTELDRLGEEGHRLTQEIIEMIHKAGTEDSYIDINSVDELLANLEIANNQIELAQDIYNLGRTEEAIKIVRSNIAQLKETKEAFDNEMKPKHSNHNEPITLSATNNLYETGTMIKLHNPSDTVVAIYKHNTLDKVTNIFHNSKKVEVIDSQPSRYKIHALLNDGTEYTGWITSDQMSGGDIKNTFRNGTPAKIIQYKQLPDKAVVYKVLVTLKDTTQYTGWIPEGVIRK